jgi:citrate lyase subunit beta/citryl-CoA lyase
MSVIRSIMFAPANLPALASKMPRSKPDVAIIDFEDGTPDPEKVSSRPLAVEALQTMRAEGWEGRVFVRVNHPSTEWYEDDVKAVLEAGFDGMALPKTSSVEDVQKFNALVDAHVAAGGKEPEVIVGIESGRGVIHIEEILDEARNVVGVYFGGEDYATSIGGVRSESNIENHYPRSRVALSAKVRGLSCFDQGVVSFKDDERYLRECAEARGFGFTGKICLHPRQTELANKAFRPTDEEVAFAKRLLEEYEKALQNGHATPNIDGMMIDGPLVKRAEAILVLAEA